MDNFKTPLFNALFNTSVPRVILKADAPDFTIITYNDAYKLATNTSERDIKGLSLWEAYDPKEAGSDSGRLLLDALTKAAFTKETVSMPPFHYDIPAKDPGKTEHSWWQLEIVPVQDENGESEYLITTTYNITAQVLNQKGIEESLTREQNLIEELSATNEELLSTNDELIRSQFDLQESNNQLEHRVAQRTNDLSQSEASLRQLVMTAHYALMILRGRDWIIEVANQQLVNLWDKTLDEVIGRPLMEILPEIENQPFPGFLRQVFETGTGYGQEEEIFYYNSPTGPATKYVSFYYDPMFDGQGNVSGIIVAAEDITDKVFSRQMLEASYVEQQALNEELSAINEELEVINEEQLITNEQLALTQQSLQEMVLKLAHSEARIRSMLADAPVAIGVLKGHDLVIETANTLILRIWGKSDQIIGKPLAQALPELEGQPFLKLLDQVYTSGETYRGNEAHALLEHKGELTDFYFNFIYQALKNEIGVINSVMVVAIDVTEQVNLRKAMQRAEEMLRFSVEGANAGTWFMNVVTREFIPSPRLKELFGFNPEEEVDYQAVLDQIPDEYRGKISKNIERAITTGRNYTMEHPIVGFHDQKERWVKAFGKVYPDASGNYAHFSGLLFDITEQKNDDIRKSDFIGMVIHELKTPLTSLSAYAQMLHARAKNSNDGFTAVALEKVSIQVKKMTIMINGFLNVSRLESGKIYLDKKEFELNKLLNEITEEAILISPAHAINLVPCETIWLNADRDKIGSVISNLLSNAIKYSPGKKNVEVLCRLEDNMATVGVKDEGVGVNPQDIERLFDRYYRVENQNTQHISGFGIGLYLCAEIIQRHNGRIWVESEVGKGSTFWFTLPQE